MNETIKHKEVWNGEYRGIKFEIQKFHLCEKEAWTYYIYINLERIPKKYKPNSFWLRDKNGKGHYDYYSHCMSDIQFHGGMTWYSKVFSSKIHRIIKIGCDYQHYHDEGCYYHVDMIILDVKETIDSFRDMIKGYKYWCIGNGGLYDESEGTIENGVFHSNDYINKVKQETKNENRP